MFTAIYFTMMNIGEKVREIRTNKGMTQKAVAEAASLSTTFITLLEGGKYQDIETRTLIALAKALEVEISDLLKES